MDHKPVSGLILLLNVIVSSQETNVQIPLMTKKGPIVGLRVDPNPLTGVSYDAFLGIPYANQPARFQISEERSSWTEPLITQADGPMCPQPGPPSSYSEDCLYLNVFTPVNAATASSPYAVIVFIHGSGFTFSSSSSAKYGPDFLVNSSVILVAMNYRLGAPGFLTLGSAEAPGNLGLHDTLLALQWVQNEIAAFGGNPDPTQITLYGQSAGSAMTQFHYLSPLSKGLWGRAITSSGSMLAEWAHYNATEGERRARLLAQGVGCDSTADKTTVLKCLQAADIKDILANQSITTPVKDVASGNSIRFIPVLDSYLTSNKPFFNDTLSNLMEEALKRAKPLINGCNTDEGINKFMDGSWMKVQDNLDAFIPEDSLSTLNADQITAITNKIRNRYFPDTIALNRVEGSVRITTEKIFDTPTFRVSKYFANLTHGYLNKYEGAWSPTATYFAQYNIKGVDHGDELNYIFYKTKNPPLDLSTCPTNLPNLIMKDKVVGWFTTFAKTGSPGPDWPTVAQGGYMVFGNYSLTKSSNIESNYLDFWDNLTQTAPSAASSSLPTLNLLFLLLCITFICL